MILLEQNILAKATILCKRPKCPFFSPHSSSSFQPTQTWTMAGKSTGDHHILPKLTQEINHKILYGSEYKKEFFYHYKLYLYNFAFDHYIPSLFAIFLSLQTFSFLSGSQRDSYAGILVWAKSVPIMCRVTFFLINSQRKSISGKFLSLDFICFLLQ